MTTEQLQGSAIAAKGRERIAEFEQLAARIDPAGAAAARGDDWSLNEVLSHLIGDPDEDFVQGIQRALNEDAPALNLQIGTTYLADRAAETTDGLVNAISSQYAALADFVEGLNEDQLARPLRWAPLAEFMGSDTLPAGQWAMILFDQHMPGHFEQIEKQLST